MTVKEAFQKAKLSRLERITIPTIRNIIGRELTELDKKYIEEEKKKWKEEKRIESEKNAPVIKYAVITINWVRNPTWGNNPNGFADVYLENGSYDTFKYKCSGCGYDKLSHCVGGLLNQFLLRPLWETKESSYGFYKSPDGSLVRWNQGCGIETIIDGLEKCGYEVVSNRKSKREDIFYITRK